MGIHRKTNKKHKHTFFSVTLVTEPLVYIIYHIYIYISYTQNIYMGLVGLLVCSFWSYYYGFWCSVGLLFGDSCYTHGFLKVPPRDGLVGEFEIEV